MADETNTPPAPTSYAVGDRILCFGREYECIEVGVVTGRVARSSQLWRRVEDAPAPTAVYGPRPDYFASRLASAFADMGRDAALRGEPRDWKKPDAWHRGYMRGLLAKYKARQRTMREANALAS